MLKNVTKNISSKAMDEKVANGEVPEHLFQKF